MELCKITIQDADEISNIAAECFLEDRFYINFDTDIKKRKQKIKEAFLGSIPICLEYGHVYGHKLDGRFVSFSMWFDYHLLEKQSPEDSNRIFGRDGGTSDFEKMLKEEDREITKVLKSSTEYWYLLAIASLPEFRRKGLAREIIVTMQEAFPQHNIFADVSNLKSVELYKNLGFTVPLQTEEYCFVQYLSQQKRLSKHVKEKPYYRLALPQGFDYTLIWDREPKLHRHEIVINHTCIDTAYQPYFRTSLLESSKAALYDVSYEELIKYERFINVLFFDEIYLEIEDEVVIIYKTRNPYQGGMKMGKETLKDAKEKSVEWSIIPDTYVSIPIKYTNTAEGRARLEKIDQRENDFLINRLLHSLHFRTTYEAGLPTEDYQAERGFRSRLQRYYLGRVDIQVLSETKIDFSRGQSAQRPIGDTVSVALILSIDKMTECGVLHIVSLSSSFFATQYLDSVLRNDINICIEDNKHQNFFVYLKNNFGIEKKGFAKVFMTIPEEKKRINPNLLKALMFCETLYQKGEDLGIIRDQGIVEAIQDKNNQAQYDYAHVYNYSNILIQVPTDYQNTIYGRIKDEAITLFYLELILFEESALNIANDKIVDFLTSSITDLAVENSIENIKNIIAEHSQTIEFWDIQTNYPSTRQSINDIRDKFNLQEIRDRLKRNQKQLLMVYNTRNDLTEKNSAKILNYIALLLALVTLSDFINALFTGNRSWWLIGIILLLLITCGWLLIHFYRTIRKKI